MARRLAEKSISLAGPLAPEMYRNFAEVLWELDQNQEAVNTIQKAALMDPSNKEIQELMKKWGASPQKKVEHNPPSDEVPLSNLW